MPIPDADRTTPIKWEDPSGGDTPEAYGPTGANPNKDAIQVRGLYGQPDAATPTLDEDVWIGRDGDDWKFQDKNTGPHTLSDLVASSSGITEPQHEALDSLTHAIAEDSYTEYTYSGIRPINVTTWDGPGKVTKIRERSYTWTGNKVTQVQTIQYDAVGSPKKTVTVTLGYTGGRLSSITRVVS